MSALALLVLSAAAAAQSVPESARRVDCPPAGSDAAACRVDLSTYLGYRVFAQFCSRCHALDALGSSFAPNLVERIGSMDKSRFVFLMERGYAGSSPAMPVWGEDPYVSRYYEELWAYLSARASGKLLAGEPALAEPAAAGPASP